METLKNTLNALILIALLSYAPHVHAKKNQDQKQEESTTQTQQSIFPEFCEFTTELPEPPTIKTICEDDEKKRCYQEVRYTKFFDMQTSMDVRLICNKLTPEAQKNYNETVITTTLKAMTRDKRLKHVDTVFNEYETHNHGAIMGDGMVGKTPSMFIGQLLIGKNSALSVEAELIGEENPTSDKMFADILASIHPIEKTAETSEESTSKEENAKSEKSKKEEE